jgi:transcriptional regulator
MLRKLISFVFLLVVGWLVYTQFYGTEKEQQLGQEVISNGKKTIQSIFSIFQHENDKFKAGAYDDSLEKVGSLLKDLGEKMENKAQKEELEELVSEKERISDSIEKNKIAKDSTVYVQNKEDLKVLVKNIDKLLQKI